MGLYRKWKKIFLYFSRTFTKLTSLNEWLTISVIMPKTYAFLVCSPRWIHNFAAFETDEPAFEAEALSGHARWLLCVVMWIQLSCKITMTLLYSCKFWYLIPHQRNFVRHILQIVMYSCSVHWLCLIWYMMECTMWNVIISVLSYTKNTYFSSKYIS